MSKTVAQHLIDLMVDSGVRNVYGVVGDSANPIVDGIRRTDGRLRWIAVRHEEAGAFAAGAEAQVTGRPAAVVGSSGPGSLHLLNGLYDCQRNAAPVFAIATHIPSTELGTRSFQDTRPELIFADCTYFCQFVSSPAQMPRIAEVAMQSAILEHGVGMVIVPGDIAGKKVEEPLLAHPIAEERALARPPETALARAAKLVAEAERIVIFGGDGCRGARAEVLELAELLQAPVAYTYRGKDVLEADNPNGVGMTGLLGWGGATAALGSCDLLLMLGTDFPYRHFLPDDATIVQVDERPDHLGRRAKLDLGLVGDVGETLRALRPHLQARLDRTFLDQILDRHRVAFEKAHAYVNHPGTGHGLRPELVAHAIGDLAAPGAIFTVDTGMCNIWGARYLHMRPGQRLLASFGHGSMANAMPQAIGAQLAAPNRQVVALCGDGGLTMLMGELLTVAALQLPIKLMVFDNSTLGLVRIEMQAAGYPPFGTDLQNPDFAELARVVGLHGERVEQPDDIHPAIERAFAHDGPALIDFVTDPRALALPPKTDLSQVEGFALAATKLVFGGDSSELLETIKSNIRTVRKPA